MIGGKAHDMAIQSNRVGKVKMDVGKKRLRRRRGRREDRNVEDREREEDSEKEVDEERNVAMPSCLCP